MSRPSFFRRIMSGMGRVIDILRTWLGRLIFLLVLGFVLYLLFSGPAAVEVPEQSALVLAPSGRIVEQNRQPGLSELLAGPAALRDTELQDLLDALKRASVDQRIAALVLDLDELLMINPVQVEILEDAMQGFRDGGKPIYAYGEYFTQSQYALAAGADTITLNPMGSLLLPGYGGNQLFFRDLLDRLGVTVHVFTAGAYKSAAEPFTRMGWSENARENNQQLVDELWARYIDRVSAAREIPVAQLRRYTEELPALARAADGDMAGTALNHGLVDSLATRDEFRAEMMSRLGRQNGSFRQIHFRDYLRASRHLELPSEQQIGVIVAEGAILPGRQAGAFTGAESIIRLIRQATATEAIRALVLRIDSPGGEALASEAIRSELSRVQAQGKPVVISMGGTAASGAYWIASTADQIWAAPTTITGSIGVVGIMPSFENALTELGVGTDGVGTTPLTRGGDPLGGLNPQMQQLLQTNVEYVYRRFLDLVMQGRNLSRQQVQAAADGRVWSGAQARSLGLVDELGDLSDAVEAAAKLAGLEQWREVRVRPSRSLSEQMLDQLLERASQQTLLNLVAQAPLNPVPTAFWQPLLELLRSTGRAQPRALLLCEFCLSLRSP